MRVGLQNILMAGGGAAEEEDTEEEDREEDGIHFDSNQSTLVEIKLVFHMDCGA